MKRRNFIKKGVVGSVAVGSLSNNLLSMKNSNPGPRIISTWKHGVPANKIAWELLKKGDGGLTAVEYGVRDSEDNPDERSVGFGGLPDREGKVTLDACIMDKNNDLSLIHI